MISYKMNQSKENIINGVSVDKLFETMNAINTNTNISKFNFRSKGNWVNGAHSQTNIKEFYGACQTHNKK